MALQTLPGLKHSGSLKLNPQVIEFTGSSSEDDSDEDDFPMIDLLSEEQAQKVETGAEADALPSLDSDIDINRLSEESTKQRELSLEGDGDSARLSSLASEAGDVVDEKDQSESDIFDDSSDTQSILDDQHLK